MSYVLRTDKISPPQYFCGLVQGEFFGNPIALSNVVFNAMDFESEQEALTARDELGLGADFTVSELGGFGMSDNLAPPPPKEPNQ